MAVIEKQFDRLVGSEVGIPVRSDLYIQDVVAFGPAEGGRPRATLLGGAGESHRSCPQEEGQDTTADRSDGSGHDWSIVNHLNSVIPALAFVTLLACVGCADPSAALLRHEESLGAGELERAQETLLEALERHPDDVPLLCAAATFYLGPSDEGRYKPRLALRYALRADQAARGSNAAAARLFAKAHRAAGGLTALPEGEALLAAGLEQVGHPDAASPRRLRPFDSDLLEPTFENYVEQSLRWKKGKKRPTCSSDQLLVPGGAYPRRAAPDQSITVSPFCIGRMPSVDVRCSPEEQRQCSADEVEVVREALLEALWGDRGAHRCCGEPILARVKPG